MHEELTDLEVYILSQFIDVMEVIEDYENIEDIKNYVAQEKKIYLEYIENIMNNPKAANLSIFDNNIGKRIKKHQKDHGDTEEYDELVKKIKENNELIKKELPEELQSKVDETTKLIAEKSATDVKWSYLTGVTDATKKLRKNV